MDISIVICGSICRIIAPLDQRLIAAIDKTLRFEDIRAADFHPSWDGVYHLFDTQKLIFETGHLATVLNIIDLFRKKTGMTINVIDIDARNAGEHIPMPDSLIGKTMLPYQKDAVEKFLGTKYGIGTIQCPTGSGKTLISAEITRYLGIKTLFVVNRKILLHQTKKVYEELLGHRIGIIGDDQQDFQPISIATIQTLSHISKKPEVQQYLASIGFAVWDECHFCSAITFRKVGRLLMNTKWRLGLSATVQRDDKKDIFFEGVVGEVICDVTADDVAQEGIIIKPRCIFIRNPFDRSVASRHMEWHEMYRTNIVNDKWRNDVIVKIAQSLLKIGKKALVLTSIIDHGKELSTTIGCMLVNGKIDKKSRLQQMEEFAKLESNVMCGTSSIFSTGYDNTAIDCVINASGNAGQVATIQMIGRAMRSCSARGKNAAFYIDFIDSTYPHRRHSDNRVDAVKSRNYDTIFIDENSDVDTIVRDVISTIAQNISIPV